MRKFSVALGNYGLTRPIKDGTVKPEGVELDFIEIEPITAGMRRMVRRLDLDICEMAFVTYLCARALGKPVTAIPIFVTRNFHHGAVFHNVKAGLKVPKDLERRTIGVNRGYTVTTGVWTRGILQHEYGVDLGSINWAASDDEHVAEYVAPANVDYSRRGTPMAEQLAAGTLPAAVGDIRSTAPDLARLIPNAREAGFAAFRKTGIYPINHTIAIKNSVLEEMPSLPAILFDMFRRAKAQYLARLEKRADLAPADEAVLDRAAVVGDPFPFGVAANRPAIEAINRYSLEQQVIPEALAIEQLFAASTLALA